MQDFRRADGGQVAVALVGEDDLVRLSAFQPRRHGGRASVRGLHRVDLEIMIHQHRAADRRDQDRPFADAQLVNRFSDQPVDQAVGAARAIVRIGR